MKKLKEKLLTKKWFKMLGFILIPFYIVFCYFIAEYTNSSSVKQVAKMALPANQPKLWFALIVLTLLSAVILLLVRRVWIYATVFGSITLIMGVINCLKVAVNGDNFAPWDITMVGNAGQLASFAKFDLPWLTYVWVPFAVIFCFFFWFTDAKIPLKWYITLPSTLVIIVPVLILYNYPNKVETVINKFGMSFANCALQSSNYKYNGFVNAFTINCFSLKVVEPEGYSEETINSYLSKYSGVDPTQSPDVIAVMSEAFFDIRTLNGTEFSVNPLSNFDEIKSRKNTCSGTLYTTAYGGGTVRTEFDFLTGLSVDTLVNSTSPWLYVNDDIETYVSNYKSQGYTTTAVHTYMKKFYMRDVAYPHLGFDKYIGQEDLGDSFVLKYRRGYLTDDVFADVVIDVLEKNPDTPNFVYGITMENHGGYDKSNPEDIVVEVKNDLVDDDMLDQITTYTQGVYYADKSLKKLIDYVDSRKKPTVVVFFGDHKPAFGIYERAFNQAGNIYQGDGYDETENKFIYSAPYLVYANYDIDFKQLSGGDGEVSAYYMLSLIAEATGTKMTPYMQFLADGYKTLPCYNVRLGITLSGENESFVLAQRHITFDRISGKKYSFTQGE